MNRELWKDIERFLDDVQGLSQASAGYSAGQRMPLPMPAAPAHAALAPDTPPAPRPSVQHESVPDLHALPVDADARDEVQALKLRYIVGRVVGRDLFDGSGQRIVSQGEVITEEAVFRAEQAGKLVELIVHMSSTGVYDGQ